MSNFVVEFKLKTEIYQEDILEKRFGKSLGNKVPSMFLNILERKLLLRSLSLKRIDTWSVKASQYNHIEDSYKKKKYSAFHLSREMRIFDILEPPVFRHGEVQRRG